ncbi:MAG: NapC/NirT family cytochrome c, partial [Thermodesulfobacteriota bacterium]
HIVSGVRDTYAEFTKGLDTEESYDAHRAEMARNARMSLKKWDSSPCRACHKNVRPENGHGKEEHKRMETEGLTCIDCHQGIYHKPVPEEKLSFPFFPFSRRPA